MTDNNLWILTEERPKKEVIKKIIDKTKELKNLDIQIENFKIEPIITNNIFNHVFKVVLLKSKSIKNVFIKLISSGKQSSFVDFLVFLQKEKPKSEQILKNCIYAIEETKTNTYDSRNTAMGQRSSKFNTLNYYIHKHKYEIKPVMYFSHKQAENDHDSVQFINRCLCHLESGIEFWGKDSSSFKKFNSLEEMISEKNRIAEKNTRKNDTPIKITKKKDIIKISGLLANPGKTTKKRKYTGTIGHDPNIGQLPLIAKTLRMLGWKKNIIITDHRILPKKAAEGDRGNKFTRLAKYINFELENCPFKKTNFHKDYWKYEKDKEKVSTILAQIFLENKDMKTIFDNHGGCEKSFFYGPNDEEIKISKKFSNKGGKIPDLVVKDHVNKKIYLYEGKTSKYIKKGLKELKAFALFEKMYLKEYYPDFEYERSLIINGSADKNIAEVKFQLNNNYEIIKKDEFN